ncbi:hypothetical protein [Geodermatophilus sp. SYSU D01176]
MSAELHADDRTARPACGPADRRRPTVSGDLPSVLEAAPMFRRAVAGYDRFQVDTYVRWAEDELATADREREHLVARHLSTLAALEEARELLAHSSGGGEFLRVSRRIGAVLAAAADEADAMRADAEADRTAASAQADRVVALADQVLADARAEAERVVAAAVAAAGQMRAEAARLVERGRQTDTAARADAEARLEELRATERRAVQHAERIRQVARDEASAARLQAQGEVVGMLVTAREERRRADAEAAASRDRLDGDALARRASLLSEVEDLERRRALLRTGVERTTGPDLPALRRHRRGPLRWVRGSVSSRG